jgi:hypothetical protein
MSVIARDSFKFKKRLRLFIRLHNETLSVAAVCVSSEKHATSGSI